MPTVNFKIHNKSYFVDCGVGQESQIKEIAAAIDEKATYLAGMFGDVDSETLLLMVCILVMGDLGKLRVKFDNLNSGHEELKKESLDEDSVNNILVDLIKKVNAVSSSIVNDLSN